MYTFCCTLCTLQEGSWSIGFTLFCTLFKAKRCKRTQKMRSGIFNHSSKNPCLNASGFICRNISSADLQRPCRVWPRRGPSRGRCFASLRSLSLAKPCRGLKQSALLCQRPAILRDLSSIKLTSFLHL